MQTKTTICCAGGKSGGHIIPCLTFIENNYANANVLFFSANTALDKSILKENSLVNDHVMLPLGTLQYTRFYHYPLILWYMFVSLQKSLYYLYKRKPKIVISTGGLVAIPVCIAAKILRIPIELYELNATPGSAIKFLAPLANKIHVSFSAAQKYFSTKKCTVTPYPIRFENTQYNQEILYKKFGLSNTKKTLLILGGSQGSIFLNNCIKDFFNDNQTSNIQVIHQTGSIDSTDWQQFYKKHAITAHIFSYNQNMAPYYSIADLVISRAGAGTLFETQFFNKKSIIIPLETKQTHHQKDNAFAIEKQYPNLFTVMLQDTIKLNKDSFFAIINNKLNN